MQVFNLIVRLVELCFVVIVLGLSGALVAGDITSSAINDYILFCGVWGGLTVLIGMAGAFMESLQGVVMLALDGLATLFYFAGAIALAAKLGVHSCSTGDDNKPSNYLLFNDVISGGTRGYDSGKHQYTYLPGFPYTKRCHEGQAECAFMFFALACFATNAVMDLMGSRRK